MSLLPRSVVGKMLACIWVLIGLAILAFAWQQRNIHDMPEAFLLLMAFVTFPVSIPVTIAVGLITTAVETVFHIAYDPFCDIVPLWIAVSFCGYLQWCVFLPFVWKKAFGPPGM